MSKLAKLLSLPEMADRLASAGRGKDSILAHINPTEARLLKSRGGSGKRNPSTGIMEFQTYDDDPETYFSQQEAPETYFSQQEAPETYFSQQEAPAPVEEPKQGAYLPNAPAPEPSQGAYLPSAPAETPEQSQRGAFLPNTYSGVVAAPAPAPVTPQQAVTQGSAPGSVQAAQQGAAPITGTTTAAAAQQAAPSKSFMETLKGYSTDLGDFNKALQPLAPYLKAGAGVATAVQGQEAAKQAAAQADKNAAEIKALSDPYRKQAAQLQQQGQQLMELGQGGGITSAQQKQLEIQRAQAAQQMASSGVTGGTAQQQLEANLQQQTAAFAQQNVNQGMKLVQDAMGINKTADKYIQDAITTGYSQNKDAQSLAADFYKSIAQFLTPDANTNPTSAAPGQAKVGAIE